MFYEEMPFDEFSLFFEVYMEELERRSTQAEEQNSQYDKVMSERPSLDMNKFNHKEFNPSKWTT